MSKQLGTIAFVLIFTSCSGPGGLGTGIVSPPVQPPTTASWTWWRGPLNNGTSYASTISSSTIGNLHLMWKRPLGSGGFNTPAVSNGTVVVAAWKSILAFDATRGDQLWSFSDPRSGWTEWSDPAIIGSVVVSGPANGGATLYAFDVRTGRRIWTDDFGILNGVIGGALPTQNGFIVPLGMQNEPVGCGQGKILSVDAQTGAVRWTHLTADKIGDGNGVWAAPNISALGHILASVGNSCPENYATGEGDAMIALSPQSGARAWMYRSQEAINSSEPDLDFGSTPVDANGTVVAASKSGWVYGVNDASGAVQWKYRISDHNSGPQLGGSISSPAFDGSTIYVGGGARPEQPTGRGNFAALDTSGNRRWEVQSLAPVQSPPTIANDLVFVGFGSSMVALTTSGGARRWQADTGGYLWSGAAIETGTLYFTSTDGNLYAYTLGS